MAAPYTIGPFYPLIPLSDVRGFRGPGVERLKRTHSTGHPCSEGIRSPCKACSGNTSKVPRDIARSSRFVARQALRSAPGNLMTAQSRQAGFLNCSPERISVFSEEHVLEHEPGFDRAACLVGVGSADAKSNIRAHDEVREVNDRNISSNEEGVLYEGRGHGE
jgi:hypothetical protein